MIVMIVSFAYQFGLKDEKSLAVVFQRFLQFYAFEFNEKTTGIDLLDK
jgi:hypothetical protein